MLQTTVAHSNDSVLDKWILFLYLAEWSCQND